MAPEAPPLSVEDEAVIQNHLNEIAALPEAKFIQLKMYLREISFSLAAAADTFHPDRPGTYDLGERLRRDFSLAREIVRRANKIRQDRRAGGHNG